MSSPDALNSPTSTQAAARGSGSDCTPRALSTNDNTPSPLTSNARSPSPGIESHTRQCTVGMNCTGPEFDRKFIQIWAIDSKLPLPGSNTTDAYLYDLKDITDWGDKDVTVVFTRPAGCAWDVPYDIKLENPRTPKDLKKEKK
ncbi:MAG: hypothetical protein ASARMPRED_004926 [Alectoria sarmentosa]|nr:MAG: hypothetical protein ASARMPRED_004926 [Alectoria sarmentosa]